jgi:cytidine deaminase
MVREGTVLGHLMSERGIEVDRAKIEVIERLPPPINIKGIRSFLSHAGFCRQFIKDFSHIAKSLSQNHPNYKSTSTKTIAEVIKFSHLSPCNSSSPTKS